MVYIVLVCLLCAVAAAVLAAIFWTLAHPPRTRRRRRATGGEDIWLWLGTALLVMAGALLSVAATIHAEHPKQSLWLSGGFTAAYVLAFVAIACLIAAIRHVPFPPWAKAKFPDIEVEFFGWIGAVKDDSGNVWRAHRVSIFNLGSRRVASLTLDYRAKTDTEATFAAKPITFTPFTRPDLEHSPPEKIPSPSDWLSPALTIEPGHMVHGLFVSELSRYWNDHMARPREEWLEILDHASQKLAAVPIRFGLQDSTHWSITDRDWQ